MSAPTVATLLKEENFSLQGNAKTIEGAGHPDRDAQFRYINDQARQHMDAGDPVISADTKKKELAGRSGRGGREWQPKGGPEQVRVHDFMDKQLGKAIPHGYDIAANAGWVNVGTAELDTGSYPSGIKVSDRDMKNLEKRAVRRHGFHGEWNYNLIPRPE